MDNIPKTFDDLRFLVMSAITPVVHLDIAINELGAKPGRPPTVRASSAPDTLAWSIDSVIAAARLMLSGQVIGAVTMIRNQLELWMSRRATALGISRRSGESTISFAARAWSQPDEFQDQWLEKHLELAENRFEKNEDEPLDDDFPAWVHEAERRGEGTPDHFHVYRSDGTEVCPALTYSLLSELLHMRVFAGAPRWDAAMLVADEEYLGDVFASGLVVSEAIFLVLREMRIAATGLAKRQGSRGVVELLSSGMDAITIHPTHSNGSFEAIPFGAGRARETIIPPVAALAPLVPQQGLSERSILGVRALARDYRAVLRKERPAGRLYEDDELAVRSFAWHRMRSIETALEALRIEQRMLGDEFDEQILAGRSTRWVMLTEAISLLSDWHPVQEVGTASAALASSLRSAYWLWLEDDDRAMAVLRNSLEYVAQLRTWRRKPAKARSLSSRWQTTPRDWITQAGWKRLHLLNQILGEFAHAKRMDEWPASRRLLAELQLNVDPERAIYTARGAAVDFVASLAAREAVALISDASPAVSSAVGRILGEMGYELDEDAYDVEAQFAHIWSVRSRSA